MKDLHKLLRFIPVIGILAAHNATMENPTILNGAIVVLQLGSWVFALAGILSLFIH